MIGITYSHTYNILSVPAHGRGTSGSERTVDQLPLHITLTVRGASDMVSIKPLLSFGSQQSNVLVCQSVMPTRNYQRRFRQLSTPESSPGAVVHDANQT